MATKELIYFPKWTAGREGYAERIRELFQDQLKQRGLSLTPQRRVILDALLKADTHLSQEEIYTAVKGKGIGKVTVFRMLKTLEESGLVEKVYDSKDRARYEVNKERPHHDHLVCLKCNRITEIQWPEVEKTQERICKKIGFQVSYHRHELFGTCKECQIKSR